MRPIYWPLNVVTRNMVRRMLPQGFDVSGEDTLDTLEKLAKHVAETGRVRVWAGGSERSIYGSQVDNWRARAWHDAVHLAYGNEFTYKGEIATLKRQIRQVQGLRLPMGVEKRVCMLLDVEVRGQLDYLERFGMFPDDQRTFTKGILCRR